MLPPLPEESTIIEEEIPPASRYEDLAGLLTLPLHAPAMEEQQVFDGCQQGKRLGMGGVLVRPSDVDLARNWAKSAGLTLGCLMGYPGGSSTTAARLYEARDLLRRGVKDLVVTINLGKLVSRKFLYLESELLQMAESCRENEATLRILFEVEEIQQDHTLIGVRLCKRTAAQGMDLLFRRVSAEYQAGVARYVMHHAKGKLAVRLHSPTLTLQDALALRKDGVAGIVTEQADSLLNAWREELDRREAEAKAKEAERNAAPQPVETPHGVVAETPEDEDTATVS